MPQKDLKVFLIITTNEHFRKTFTHFISIGGGKVVKEEKNFPIECAILDLSCVDQDMIDAIRKKNPTSCIALVTSESYSPAVLKSLYDRYNPNFVLPIDLSEDEIKAVVHTFFVKEEKLELVVSQDLVDKYRGNVFEKLDQMYSYIERLRVKVDPKEIKMLRTEAHKLAGSGASYGFKTMGQACSSLDIYLTPFVEKSEDLPKDFLSTCSSLLRKSILCFQKIELFTELKEANVIVKSKEKNASLSCIYLVSGDNLVQRLFSSGAASRFLNLVSETNPQQAIDNLKSGKIKPACMILEQEYPLFRMKAINLISAIQDISQTTIGIITSKRSIEDIVKLTDSNISFVLRKPITEQEVTEALDMLVQKTISTNQRALIVDDDPDAALVLRKALDSFGVETEVLYDERNLYKVLEKFAPNILFLDLQLETYSGFQLLKSLRSDVTYRRLSIILYTSSRSKELLLKCNESGVNDILFKPLDIEELKRKLQLISSQQEFLLQSALDLKTGLLLQESFTRRVMDLINFVPPSLKVALVLLHIQGFDILKRTYGDEVLTQIIRGVAIEAKLHFVGNVAIGLVSDEVLGVLIFKGSSGELDFQFENLRKNFLQDIQVYTSIEAPVKLYAGVCICDSQEGIVYRQLVDIAFNALKEAERKPEPNMVSLHPAGDIARISEPATVILVDDDENLLRLMSEAFKRSGFQVITFSLGQDAVDYFFSLSSIPKNLLIVLDRILPDMDGIDILRGIRIKFPHQMLVIFLSSLTTEEDVLRGIEEGAIDYVFKPFNMNILIKKAKTLIKL